MRRLLQTAAILTAFATPVAAQQPPTAEESEEPIVFQADELQTDQDLGLVVAKGNVEIAQGGRRVLADVVTYNQRTDTVTASGHVSLLEPTGEIVFADFVELSQKFTEGFVKDIRILMTDRSRMAGNTGRRTGGVRTELRRGVYSPCNLCRTDPMQPPLWQLRAERISHDEETKTIEYRDAVLEVGGFPVLYTPYLSHPDPTVKRQSGFLVPAFGSSNSIGAFATIPYFWAIAPDKDFTFSPIFTTESGPVIAGEYRQRFAAGEVRLSGSLAPLANVEDPATGDPTGREAVRGHGFGFGRWDINDTWRTGFDFARATDQTYLRRFHFGGTENYLTSRGFAEGFGRRSFTSLNSYAFQPLRFGQDDARQPVVLPVFDYNWLSEPNVMGGRLGVNANLLNLFREEGTDTRRASLGADWQRPFVGPLGDLYTLTVGLRGDAYYVNDFERDIGGPTSSGFDGRIFPQIALEWRYPWVRRGQDWSQLIEPIAAVVAAPTGLNGGKIPNEDSQAFDFDETDLFVRNRFPGLDRVDTGQRVDYGLRAAVYGNNGMGTSLLIGQSYRFQENSAFPEGSGLETRLSDIVGRLSLSPGGWFDFTYRFRLDKNDLSLERQEFQFFGGPDKLRIGFSYLDLPPAPDETVPERRQQISVAAQIGLTQNWTLAVATTQNLTGTLGTVSSGVSATYQDECLALITSLTQSGTQDRDIRPGTTFLVSVVFKNLGELVVPVFSAGGQR